MSFVAAVKRCFRHFTDFQGRARRPEFWWFFLFYVAGSLIANLLDYLIFAPNPETRIVPNYISSFFGLVIFIPLLAVAWRRLHDSDRPGWYALLPMALSFLTLVGIFSGVLVFAQLANYSANPESLRGPAAWLGLTGIAISLVLQIILTICLIYWMTRPSDLGPNRYGALPPAL